MANADLDLAVVNDTPESRLLTMMLSVASTQLIGLEAQLDIPDLPNDGAKSIETIAEATGTRKAALLQAMRALAALGIFAEPRSDHFAITHWANCCEPMCQTRCEAMPSWWRAA